MPPKYNHTRILLKCSLRRSPTVRLVHRVGSGVEKARIGRLFAVKDELRKVSAHFPIMLVRPIAPGRVVVHGMCTWVEKCSDLFAYTKPIVDLLGGDKRCL